MMLLLTLRGTPTIYYGEELGMEDAWIPSEHIQDPWEKKAPGIGVGRDPERTPMLWDGSANAASVQNQSSPGYPSLMTTAISMSAARSRTLGHVSH